MAGNEVFILEDDLTMRAMLRIVLERAGYRPVFFADGGSLLARLGQSCPACILLDLCLPAESGLDVLSELRRMSNPTPVLMLSGQGDIPTAVRALHLGAADFVEKPFNAADLIARIADAGASVETRAPAPADDFKTSWRLTRREQEVLDHLLAGSTSKIIGRKLNLSPRTVEDHRASIMRKAGVKTIAQLAIATFEAGRRSRTNPVAAVAGGEGRWQSASL
ncbi:response regulator [Bradyrhizobium sp. U531]|uniref:response regulator transcription factor n=1 Tax=Bradyrhizobium sp. U531 TaxID=3053458 RepID=UPI003F429561